MLSWFFYLCLLDLCLFPCGLHDVYIISLYVETTQAVPPVFFFKLLGLREMKLCLMELYPLVRTLFFFTLSPVSAILLECWISCLGQPFRSECS